MNKVMRKWVAVVSAMILVVAMGMTSFAAESPVASGVVNKVTSATDKNGNAVTVEVKALPESSKAAAEEIKDIENVKKILGDKFVEGMKVIDVKEVEVVAKGDDAAVEFPITITFDVPGVLPTTKVAVLHYVDGAWKAEPCEAGNGTITATFNSLSPVAFVVDENTASGTLADGTAKSPKTGEGTVLPVACAAIVLFMGAALCFRKKAR